MIFTLRNFQIKFVFKTLKTKLSIKMKEIIIGIDLGTSNCCISFIGEDGKIEILLDPAFPLTPTIPSIVSIESEGVLIGNEINKTHINSNKNIFHNFKRLIGHKLGDFPNAEWIGDNGWHWGVHRYLSEDDLKYTTDSIKEILDKCS